jgi:hypothetical protein
LTIFVILRYKEAEIVQFFEGLATRAEDPFKPENVTLFVTEYTDGRGNMSAKKE